MTDPLHMLIDARNALYRAIYAVKADRRSDKYHYITILLRQIRSWILIYEPSSIHIFWDAPRNSVWRRSIEKGYKDRTDSGYVENISEDLAICTKISKQIFKHLKVRQYERATMEADDLIYAAASIMQPRANVIISSDSDMVQIPFRFSCSKLYDPGKKKQVEVPDVNPVWQKALIGDKSDCIEGYHGIGPIKSIALLNDYNSLNNYLKEHGTNKFYKNLLLIDLSLCPKLLHNQSYIFKTLSEEVCFNEKEINSIIMEYKINGLLQEYKDLIIPFKSLT